MCVIICVFVCFPVCEWGGGGCLEWEDSGCVTVCLSVCLPPLISVSAVLEQGESPLSYLCFHADCTQEKEAFQGGPGGEDCLHVDPKWMS